MTDGQDDEPTLVVPRVATFFAAIPEPLGLPNGAYLCNILHSLTKGFPSTIALHLNTGRSPDFLADEAKDRLVVSVKFHRWRRDRNTVSSAYADVMPIVRSVGGPSFPPLPNASGEPDDRVIEDVLAGSQNDAFSFRTVLEMSTQVVEPRNGYWEACAPDERNMGPTLTRCIEAAIRIINAYRFVEQLTMRAPARERIGPVIIGATRPADPADGGWDSPVHDVLNTYALFGSQGGTKVASEAAMERMSRILFLQEIGHPMMPLLDLQTNVNTAFHLDGDFRATVIFAHCASEVLLDTEVLSMMFEEARTPIQASAIFDKPLKTRLLTEYHERLGGAWIPTGTKPVARWLRDLLELRHRVAHVGYAPTYDEARLAREAHFSLGSHLRDRLTARLKNYPLTAGMIVTPGGFARRNVQTKASEAAATLAESPKVGEFLEWSNEVLALRV